MLRLLIQVHIEMINETEKAHEGEQGDKSVEEKNNMDTKHNGVGSPIFGSIWANDKNNKVDSIAKALSEQDPNTIKAMLVNTK